MATVVRFDRVTLTVGSKVILRNVSFHLAEGQKAVIRGRSGTGKSTLLKTVLGLHQPDTGRVLFDEHPVTKDTLRTIRTHIAYIGQEPVLGAATVREALLLPFTYRAHRAAAPTEAVLQSVLTRFGLPSSLLGQACHRVSGGEKQRIAIARAQLLGKRCYLLDEVTSALDAVSKTAVLDHFADSSLTVLSVSHDPAWIARCDTVFELADGQLTRMAQ